MNEHDKVILMTIIKQAEEHLRDCDASSMLHAIRAEKLRVLQMLYDFHLNDEGEGH